MFSDGLCFISRVTLIRCYWIHPPYACCGSQFTDVQFPTTVNPFVMRSCRVKRFEKTRIGKYIAFVTLIRPIKAETSVLGCLISFRLMWLCACVWLWPHHGASTAPCLQSHFDIRCIRTCKALTKMSLQIERCVRLLDQRLCNMLIMWFENAEDSFHLIGMIGLHVNEENERLERNRVVVDLKFGCCQTASKLCAQMVAVTLVLL